MKKLILDVCELCQQEYPSLTAYDLDGVIDPAINLHPEVKQYFSECVPAEGIDLPCYRTVSPESFKEQNTEHLPSSSILNSGFITFGTTLGGDAIVVEAVSGKVYKISHEIFDENSIAAGKGGAYVPITKENVIESALSVFESIQDFFKAWKSELVGIHYEKAVFLENSEKDPNALDEFGNHMLTHCIREGDIDGVRQETDRGADVELMNGEGRTALAEAVAFDHIEIAKYLIKFGAEINGTCKLNQTPLMIATIYSNIKSIQLLLNHGADIGMKDDSGKTALDHVCIINGTDQIRKLLK